MYVTNSIRISDPTIMKLLVSLVTEEVSEEMRDSLAESLPTARLQIGQAPLHSPC